MSTVLAEVFLLNRRSLLSAVLRIVKDRQTAEDLAQEAYVRAHEAAQRRPILYPQAFLRQTARNLALDHARWRTLRQRHLQADPGALTLSQAEPTPSAEEMLLENERLALFESALGSLPARAREAWRLTQIEGLTYEQIAKRLGVSRNTVYNDIKLVVGHCHDVLTRYERG